MSDATASSSETPPPRTTGGGFRWEPPTAAELQAMMPGYTIEKILGRGGMGAVYRGVQTNLDRPVAIKILPPGVEKEDPSFAERFKSEARLMAKLNHPAVVAVYDFGTTAAGQLYFAMEYVDGSDVSQMIAAQGRLPPEHALAITAHVCDALSAAHELGIVHRDIKPANVLINMKGQVKVADFGLAKIEDPGQHGLTKTGYAMGTPDFVAPEALMLGTAVDGRADLYAVGVMLYQMLTGNIPRGAFKPASVLVPGLDRRYDPIIQKAMQHDREERHQSAAELRRELDVILTVPLVRNDTPVSAAIPVAQVAQAPGQRSAVAQKPVAKGPQAPEGRRVRQNAEAAQPPNRTLASAPTAKSKTPLFIGIGAAAAIAVGAFVMMGGEGRRVRQNAESAATSRGTLASSPTSPAAPIKVREDPKPAAAPISNPKSTISDSTAQQFPPGKWVKVFTKFEDLPETMRKPDSGVTFEDGWISSKSKPVGWRHKTGMRNCAVRVTSTKNSTFELRVRDSSLGDQCYALMSTNRMTRGSNATGKLVHTDLVKGSAPAGDGVWELAVIGNRVIGRSHGQIIGFVSDESITSGYPALLNGLGRFGDIEVINLDGLPEAEALKILGVDEKGNDLRGASLAGRAAGPPAAASGPAMTNAANAPAPANAALEGPSALPSSTVSASPSLPVSKSSPAFPPGQWVKVFTTFEELPENLRKPDSGVKFEDGWIRFEISRRLYVIDSYANYAIRARCQRDGKAIQAAEQRSIILRGAALPSTIGYTLACDVSATVSKVREL